MSKPVIAKISAVVNGGKLSAESLRFEMDINSFPVVRCSTTAPTNDPVKSPLSSELLKRIADLQKKRLAGVTKTDVTIVAKDGTGGSLKFAGFTSAPVLQMNRYSTIDQFSAIGEDALIDSLDLSIYTAGYTTSREETGGRSKEKLKPILASEDGKIAATISEITDVLVKNYDVTLAGETFPITRELLGLQHQINTNGPLELWKKVLSNSNVVFKSWDKAFKLNNYLGVRLSERVKEILTSRTPGFWNKMRAIMSDFQMFYVPSFEGVGKFERGDKKVGDPEGEIEVSLTGLSVADGSARLLQPGGVTMIGPTARASRLEAAATPHIPKVVAFAPDPLLPGFIQTEVIPFWLQGPLGVPIMGSELDETKGAPSAASDKRDLSLTNRKKRQEQGFKYKAEVDLVSAGVMTEICELVFKEIQLASSTAMLSLPLDFKVSAHIGKRVTVKVLGQKGEKAGEFTAFVTGMTHSVDLAQGKSLNSSTQVRCSHVQY